MVAKHGQCQLKVKSSYGNNIYENGAMGIGGKPVGTPEK